MVKEIKLEKNAKNILIHYYYIQIKMVDQNKKKIIYPNKLYKQLKKLYVLLQKSFYKKCKKSIGYFYIKFLI